MNIVLFSGSGYIGTELCHQLAELKHTIYYVSQIHHTSLYPSIRFLTKGQLEMFSKDDAPKIDAIINLSGESIFQHWTKESKNRIQFSRFSATKMIKDFIRSLSIKPAVYIQASSISIYGTSLLDKFTEESSTTTSDFLSYTATKWEQIGKEIEELGIRTIYVRTGLVLSNGRGPFEKLHSLFKYYLGAKIASGKQWISWIHMDDFTQLILYCINHLEMKGPVNAVSPNPVHMRELSDLLSDFLDRPNALYVPSSLVRFILGDMGILLLEGQHVRPEKALYYGFSFRYGTLEKALDHLLEKREPKD